MKKLFASALLLATCGSLPARSLHAQDAASDLTSRFTALLHRADTGHSPSPEDLAAAGDPSQSIPDAAAVTQALPLILKALDHPDPLVNADVLLTLQNFRSGEINPIFKGALAAALAPAIPHVASHLADEGAQTRTLAAIVLGGFAPNPPATVYPPLFAYLKRDDAISPVGLSVVEDLLDFPISDATAAAVIRYLRRSDQTAESRSSLIDTISTRPNQNASIDAVLLAFMDSDDPSLRARLILSLPQLDLPPDAFADTRARVAQLAQNDSENLQVVSAARAVAPCWTAPHMSTPCPIYEKEADKPAEAAPPK